MKKRKMITPLMILSLAVLSLFIVQGCGLVGGKSNPLEPTLTALSGSISTTLTAAKQDNDTTHVEATAEMVATQKVEAAQTTQTAVVVVEEQKKEATQAVAGPILAELPTYGLDESSGKLGWLHDPLTLELSGYHEFKYGNDHMNVTAADFVLASDITWDTQYGGSGCGFMFRSNGNKEKPSQYMVMATRFAAGHVAFVAMKDGELANFHDFYPRDDDKSFQRENGTTNRLTVVGRGNIIEIYTNGVKIGEVDTTKPPTRPYVPAAPKAPADAKDIPGLQKYQKLKQEYDDSVGLLNSQFNQAMKNYMNSQAVLTDGFLAMVALSESGQTKCNFDNTWLWLIEPEQP